MEKFNQFKSEILKRAKEVSACTSQYQRAYKSESFDQLFLVIKDNFFYCCNNKIIDPDLIESVKEEARECGVYHNESATNAFILGSGNCSIEGYDNCSIEGYGNSYLNVYSNMDCKISDHAIMRYRDTNEVVIVKGNLKVKTAKP